jgi:hypothetical protein
MNDALLERWIDPFPWKRWLEHFPWEAVVDYNRQFCRTGDVPFSPTPGMQVQAKALWEKTRDVEQGLRAVFDLCRECYQLAPFPHFNGDTFSAIARALSQEGCARLKKTKSNIFYSAVGHYITGSMEKEEFDKIYRNVARALIVGDTEPLNPSQ